MKSLLRADFRRYYSCYFFYVCLTGCFLLTAYFFFRTKLQQVDYIRQLSAGSLLMSELGAVSILGGIWGNGILFASPVGVDAALAAFYAATFVRKEFYGQAARYKLAKGCSRRSVFLSLMTVCVTGAVVMRCANVLFLVLLAAVFEPLLLPLYLPDAWAFLLSLAILLTTTAALACFAVFVYFCLMKQGFYTVLIVLTLLLTLFYAAAEPLSLSTALSAPEYYVEADIYDGDAASGGADEAERLIKNPQYVSGVRRVLYTVLYDGTPWGQEDQFGRSNRMPDRAGAFPICNAVYIAAFTAAGAAVFRKRELG